MPDCTAVTPALFCLLLCGVLLLAVLHGILTENTLIVCLTIGAVVCLGGFYLLGGGMPR